jgi:DNA-binding NarL/FixJ family response regulator
VTLRVVLVDDHRMFREAMCTLLAQTPGFEVAGEAGDGQQAVELCALLAPDVVIMDVSMPGLNGLEATRRILADRPRTRVVVLSMHADRRFVAETLRAGATAYVLKDAGFAELVRALQAVAEGRTYLSEPVRQLVVQEYVAGLQRGDRSAFSLLSAREREVLQLVAEGASTKEIGDRLSISVKTVETHRRQIMEKLDLHSVAELTKYAIREGLTPLD